MHMVIIIISVDSQGLLHQPSVSKTVSLAPFSPECW